MNRFRLLLLAVLLASTAWAQTDTTGQDIFKRIINQMQSYRLDTSAVPDDKITRTIRELRELRGGFNIQEAIAFKLAEDRQNGEVPKAALDQFATFIQQGDGKRWLDNAVMWIYRRHFTYKELRQLVKFYRTSAGQKMATDFPILMLQSLRAAEMIKEVYEKRMKKQ